MKLGYFLGRAAAWPVDRVMRMRWFPLLRTFRLRENWLYDACRIAGSRDFRCIFDVGANTGQTTSLVLGYFPSCAIYSFEPVGETFRVLRQNMRGHPNVHPRKLALGRESGSLEIEIQAYSEMNSLKLTPKASGTPSGSERVEIGTLDEFCSANGIDAIDVLKTDAQGCDVDVLSGGEHLLSNLRIPFVYSEVSFQEDDATNTHFGELNTHLVARGFRLFGFYEQFGGPEGGCRLQFCNALYVNAQALRGRFNSPRQGGSG